MADEESPRGQEGKEGKEPKSKKNLLIMVGAFVLLYILIAAGNFIHLQMTYVPPEPEELEEALEPEHEEVVEGPVMKIDLGEEEEEFVPEELIAEAVEDTLEIMRQDSIAQADSINALITGYQSRIREGDSLLAQTLMELDRVKKQLKIQVTEADSLNVKRSAKLAKIVESMPPEEAAKMLEPLEDLMVLDVLMRLKQRQAAKIMAEFSSQRAARLSEVILKPLVHG